MIAQTADLLGEQERIRGGPQTSRRALGVGGAFWKYTGGLGSGGQRDEGVRSLFDLESP